MGWFLDGLYELLFSTVDEGLTNSNSSAGEKYNKAKGYMEKKNKEYNRKAVSSLNEIERKYGDKLTAEQRQNLNEKREMHKQRT